VPAFRSDLADEPLPPLVGAPRRTRDAAPGLEPTMQRQDKSSARRSPERGRRRAADPASRARACTEAWVARPPCCGSIAGWRLELAFMARARQRLPVLGTRQSRGRLAAAVCSEAAGACPHARAAARRGDAGAASACTCRGRGAAHWSRRPMQWRLRARRSCKISAGACPVRSSERWPPREAAGTQRETLARSRKPAGLTRCR
jgi:hypothetical protein